MFKLYYVENVGLYHKCTSSFYDYTNVYLLEDEFYICSCGIKIPLFLTMGFPILYWSGCFVIGKKDFTLGIQYLLNAKEFEKLNYQELNYEF